MNRVDGHRRFTLAAVIVVLSALTSLVFALLALFYFVASWSPFVFGQHQDTVISLGVLGVVSATFGLASAWKLTRRHRP